MTPALALVLATFFASGFAALVYQVIWQRLLAIFSGADVFSATVIVSAFMAGLGLGSWSAGIVADRVSRRTSLLLCAGAEAAVGLFGALSAWLYYGVLYEHLGPLGLGRGATGGALFVSLLWPTFFMGASLPLLARGMTHSIDRASFTVGALYGVNALGAACGALVSTWVLLPAIGLEGSLRVGAWINALCAAALVLPALRLSGTGASPSPAPRGAPDGAGAGRGHAASVGWWMLVYACCGFIALSYEIVWFRVLGVVVKSTAFTFGTLLALYLTGLGLGSVLGSRMAPRLVDPARGFFVLQALAGLSAALLLTGFVAVVGDIRSIAGYLAQYEPLNVRESVQAFRTLRAPSNFLRLYVLVPCLLVVPPTLLMGCAFPVLQRVVQQDSAAVGRGVGWMLVANIMGSIAGTVVTGGWLLGVVGTAGTVRLLALASVPFAYAALRRRAAWLSWSGVVTALVVVAAVPNAGRFWATLHGAAPGAIVFAEDTTGLSVIRPRRAASEPTYVFVNGMGQSVLPYGDVHTALGAIPVLLHPAPLDVAIVGLGSGDTVYAAASRPDTKRIVCVEIVGPQLTTLKALALQDGYGGLHGLLRDSRVDHVVGDGRAFLLRSKRRFDVIEADALRPTSAHSGNLYSDGYFRLVRSRLKPGGLATTWAPTKRIHDGFLSVFPYVVSLPGLLIGSNDPIAIDRDLLRRRLTDPRIRGHFERGDIDIDQLLDAFVTDDPVRFGPDTDRSALTDINTDLFPKDEFDLSPPGPAAASR